MTSQSSNNFKKRKGKTEKGKGIHIFKICLFCTTYLWINYIIMFWLIPICFTVIHELSHVIVANMVGCDVYEIIINYPGTSKIIRSETTAENSRLINIAGVLGSCTVAFVLNRIIYHKKKLHCLVFFPLYCITWTIILHELWQWIIGPIRCTGDAWKFVLNTPSIDATVLSISFYYLFLIVFIWFSINLLKKTILFLKRYY